MRMKLLVTVVFINLSVFLSKYASAEGGHSHGDVDIFDEILKALQVTGDVLPTEKIGSLMDKVFGHFTCSAGGPCNKTICISPTDIITTIGGNPSNGINEGEFEKLATVLMFYTARVNQHCKSNVDFSGTSLSFFEQNFTQTLITANNVTGEEQLEEFLEKVNVSYVPDEHKDDHDHDHDHGHEEVLVFEEECLAADMIINKLGHNQPSIQQSHFGDIATFVLYHLFTESHIKHKCRLLPTKDYFMNELFEQFEAINNTLSKQAFNNVLAKLKIVSTEDPHEHSERKKRSLDEQYESRNVLSRVKREAGHAHETEKTCYSADQLLAIHDTPAPISQGEFSTLCPALVYQIASESCSSSHSSTEASTTTAERYGYSTIAVFLICLCSAMGAVLFPCAKGKRYSIFMAVFMGLAVGTLTSDAVLHLIPEALGIHKHEEQDDHDHSSGGIVVEEFVWYSIVVLSGMYLFFLMEAGMSLLGGVHTHSPDAASPTDNRTDMTMKTVKENENRIAPHFEGEKNNVEPGFKAADKESKKISSLALMIILGDAVHNFADGLAIGAGFSKSITEGLGVSIAVFCHELPHELADFAVLLKSGMRFRNALFWNFFSSLTAFLGLYVSLSISQNDIARQWIFAIAAGMFIYIALVDIMPELSKPTSVSMFIYINVGILIGAAILIILAVFEGSIKV